MTSFYEKHIFFCNNVKQSGKKCCSQGGAEQAISWAKDYLIQKEHFGVGKFRVSSSGCMGQCSKGPVMVIYPEACWYTYKTQADVEAIIEHHLQSSTQLPISELGL